VDGIVVEDDEFSPEALGLFVRAANLISVFPKSNIATTFFKKDAPTIPPCN
jgi:hypothetical protein